MLVEERAFIYAAFRPSHTAVTSASRAFARMKSLFRIALSALRSGGGEEGRCRQGRRGALLVCGPYGNAAVPAPLRLAPAILCRSKTSSDADATPGSDATSRAAEDEPAVDRGGNRPWRTAIACAACRGSWKAQPWRARWCEGTRANVSPANVCTCYVKTRWDSDASTHG